MEVSNTNTNDPQDEMLEGQALVDKVREIFEVRPQPHQILQEDLRA